MEPKRVPRKHPERDLQISCMEWIKDPEQRRRYPNCERMVHIPNGEARNKIIAQILKRMGVNAGVPDLFLPVVVRGKPGAFFELKDVKEDLSDRQAKWRDFLKSQGYSWYLIRSLSDFKDAVHCYYRGAIDALCDRGPGDDFYGVRERY